MVSLCTTQHKHKDGRIRYQWWQNDALIKEFYVKEWSNCMNEEQSETSIRSYNGMLYKGEVNSNNQPHGNGVCILSHDEMYHGQWENGLQHGNGIYIKSNGEVWDAEWRSEELGDKIHYQGNWCDERKNDEMIIECRTKLDSMLPI